MTFDEQYELKKANEENKNIKCDNKRLYALVEKCQKIFIKIRRRGIVHDEWCDYVQNDELLCSCESSEIESDIFEIIRELRNT